MVSCAFLPGDRDPARPALFGEGWIVTALDRVSRGVLVLALVCTASCSSGRGGDNDDEADGEKRPNSTTSALASSDGPASTGSSVPGPGASSVTSGAASSSGSPSANIRPPQDGTYRFRQTDKKDSSEVAQTMERIADDPGRVVIRVRTEGAGSRTYAWTGEGVDLLSFTGGQRSDGTSLECTYDRPIPILRTPLRADARWSGEGKCSLGFAGSSTLTTKVTSRVERAADMTVGSVRLPVWQIVTSEVTTSVVSFQGQNSTSETKMDKVIQFAPSIGIDAKVRTASTTSKPDGTTSRGESEIELLDPRPR